jgi:hypothetical protein
VLELFRRRTKECDCKTRFVCGVKRMDLKEREGSEDGARIEDCEIIRYRECEEKLRNYVFQCRGTSDEICFKYTDRNE